MLIIMAVWGNLSLTLLWTWLGKKTLKKTEFMFLQSFIFIRLASFWKNVFLKIFLKASTGYLLARILQELKWSCEVGWVLYVSPGRGKRESYISRGVSG